MDETLKMIELAHQGDKAARDRLVTDNLGLIWSIVKRFAGRSVSDRKHRAFKSD